MDVINLWFLKISQYVTSSLLCIDLIVEISTVERAILKSHTVVVTAACVNNKISNNNLELSQRSLKTVWDMLQSTVVFRFLNKDKSWIVNETVEPSEFTPKKKTFIETFRTLNVFFSLKYGQH